MVAELSGWPYPLVYVYRHYEVAQDQRERFDRAREFLETVIIFLGLVAVGWASRQRCEPPALRDWQRQLRSKKGLALGTWLAVVRDVARDPSASSKEQVPFLKAELCDLLWEFLQDRNTYAHGGAPRRPADIAAQLRKLEQLVDRSLLYLAGVSDLRLLHVDRCGSRNDRIAAHARLLMGAGPAFDPTCVPTSRLIEDDSVVCLPVTRGTDWNLDDAFGLGPWCVLRDCPECGQPELFYARRVQETKCRYRSFEHGHDLEIVTTTEMSSTAHGPPPSVAGRRASWDDGAARSHTDPSTTAIAGKNDATPSGAGMGRNTANSWKRRDFDAGIRHPEQSTNRPVDLAGSVPRRLMARVVDATIAVIVGVTIGNFGWDVIQARGWAAVLMGVMAGAAYECLLASGKRVFDLELYSVDTGRPLGYVRRFVRTMLLLGEIVLIFPTGVAIYWILRDPAKQAWHDRVTKAVVVSRSETLRQFASGIHRAA